MQGLRSRIFFRLKSDQRLTRGREYHLFESDWFLIAVRFRLQVSFDERPHQRQRGSRSSFSEQGLSAAESFVESIILWIFEVFECLYKPFHLFFFCSSCSLKGCFRFQPQIGRSSSPRVRFYLKFCCSAPTERCSVLYHRACVRFFLSVFRCRSSQFFSVSFHPRLLCGFFRLYQIASIEKRFRSGFLRLRGLKRIRELYKHAIRLCIIMDDSILSSRAFVLMMTPNHG